MATPIKEYIAIDVEQSLNAITTGAGFNYTLTGKRPRRNNWSDITPKDKYVIINQADEGIENISVQAVTWLQPFVLMAIVRDSDETSATIETKQNKIAADIQKKLREDVTRGGYAIQTNILPSRAFNEGPGYIGIAVNIIVKYRTKINDPYTQS